MNSIGALIETPPLYESLSAFENLKARTLALGLPEKRIKDVLEIVRLHNTGKKKTGHFSLGMKQRLGIALALLAQPELLILNEPTNGLILCYASFWVFYMRCRKCDNLYLIF